MSDEDALLAAIITNPDEDTPRLVYADWLDENGQAERAEFIRVQIQFTLLSPREQVTPHGWYLRNRATELVNRNSTAWSRPFSDWTEPDTVTFRRGFLDGLHLAADVFIKQAPQLFQPSPLREVWITDAANRIVELSRTPRPSHLRIRAEQLPATVNNWRNWRGRERDPNAPCVELLPINPACAEPYILDHSWLILAFGTYSDPDRVTANRFLQDALSLPRSWLTPKDPQHFGIRPLDDGTEFHAWCQVANPWATPCWLWVSSGELTRQEFGTERPEDWRLLVDYGGW